MKLLNFLREYGDSTSIVEKLRVDGLLAREISCGICGQTMSENSVNKTDGSIFRCHKRQCRTRKSIRSGSFFEHSKLSLCECMLLLHLWSQGYSEKLIISDFDFSNKTVIDWFRYCRELCVEYFEADDGIIGGPGRIVEVDETMVVKRKNNQGRMLSQGWLFGGIERRNDGEFKCFLRLVYDRSETHLTHWIRRHIAPETHIITDGWAAYRNLSSMGYTHSTIIHENNFVSPENAEVHTQTIEATWGSLKKFIRAHGTNKSTHYIEYICEYVFRRKFSNVFESLIGTIKQKYLFN
jgi:hypothetical protein